VNRRSYLSLLAYVFFQSASAQEVAAPLGLELGKATCKGASASVGQGAARSQSAWSGGELLTLSTQAVPEIQDLQKAYVVCNRAGAVIAVELTLPKAKREQTIAQLDRKYRSVQRDIPFVGSAFISWRAKNATIDLDAPHLDFSMYLTYLAPGAKATYQAHVAAQRRALEQKQASKL